MKSERSDLLNALALKAKNRMIHRNTIGKAYGYDEVSPACEVKLIDEKDDDFYENVQRLLNSDEGVNNPIKRLMNEKIFNSLDNRGQEKYLLDTIEKYLKYRKKIEDENKANLVY